MEVKSLPPWYLSRQVLKAPAKTTNALKTVPSMKKNNYEIVTYHVKNQEL